MQSVTDTQEPLLRTRHDEESAETSPILPSNEQPDSIFLHRIKVSTTDSAGTSSSSRFTKFDLPIQQTLPRDGTEEELLLDRESQKWGLPPSLHHRDLRVSKVEDVMNEYAKRTKPKQYYLKNYYKILLLVGIFYSLPSIQFVFFQYEKKDQASVDCYFNFKCAKSFLDFSAFNNMLSNLGYVVAGVAFWIFVWMTKPTRLDISKVKPRKTSRNRNRNSQNRNNININNNDVNQNEDGSDEEDVEATAAYNSKKTNQYGLHDDRSLYYCIALATIFEGIFSALYHVCPSRLNFQFDTTFMIIGSGLLFITVFQKRHPASAPGAVRVFIFFAFIVFINFLALSNIPTPVLWTIVFVVLIAVGLVGAAHIYNHRKLPLSTVIKNCIYFWPPYEPGRLVMVMLGLSVSAVGLIVSAISSIREDSTENFPTLILGLTVINTFIYLLYYLAMKIRHRERIHWLVWFLFIAIVALWTTALYFFEVGVTNKFLTMEESAKLNKPCILFDYFDYHDVWHFLSAAGLITIALLVYILDFGLKDTPHSELALF